MNRNPVDVAYLWLRHQRRDTKIYAYIHCLDPGIFANRYALWRHALEEHRNELPSGEAEQRSYRSQYEAESEVRKSSISSCKPSLYNDEPELEPSPQKMPLSLPIFRSTPSSSRGMGGVETISMRTSLPPQKRTYAKTAGYTRKALPILFNGHKAFARPDTASDQNIMTEEFAKSQRIAIQKCESDQSIFELGNSKYIKSIGKAQVPIKVLGLDGNEEHRWFHILRKCPVPLILGMGLIEKIKLYSKKNKGLLVDCPHNFGDIPTLKWLGSPRGSINFRADGKQLVGCADSGSDLDFMSLRCARHLGFTIDRAPGSRTQVMLADKSVVETVGQVRISSIEISGFDSFEMKFHILPGLASDVIFSEEFLGQTDAFNTCAQVKDSLDPHQRLNTLISLGPVQRFLSKFLSKRRESKGLNTTEQHHADIIEAEIYRRSQANRAIRRMKNEGHASTARERERLMCEAFDRGHEWCTHCLPRLRGRLSAIPSGSFAPDLEISNAVP